MTLRRPWRVLVWSLALFGLYVVQVASLHACEYRSVGCDVMIASVAVPVAAPWAVMLAEVRVLNHYGMLGDAYDGGDLSLGEQIIGLQLTTLIVAVFVAQTMAAAALLDVAARWIVRRRRGSATSREPNPPSP